MAKEIEVAEVEKFIKTADLVNLFEAPDGTKNLTPEYVSALVKQGKIPAYRFKEKGHLFFRLSEVVEALRVQVEGAWPAHDIRRAFVAGAKWWECEKSRGTMWPSDVSLVETEAERRYPEGSLPPEDENLSTCG